MSRDGRQVGRRRAGECIEQHPSRMHPARLEGIGWDGGDGKQLTFRVESREREGERERDAAASQRVERYFSIDRSLLVNNPS